MTSPFRLHASTEHQQFGIAVLRVITGIIFCAHGLQKFQMGIAGVTGLFAHMGIPMPSVTGPLVAGLELLGGIALILGLLTRLVALGFVADMLGALLFVHISRGLIGPGGYQLVLSLLAASLALTLGGPGTLAVDAMIGNRTAPGGR